jgi:hypothetical protein
MCGIRSWILSDAGQRRQRLEISVGRFPPWLGIGASKFYDWRESYGRLNEHKGWIPGISGWSRGRRKRSSASICRIRWKSIGG